MKIRITILALFFAVQVFAANLNPSGTISTWGNGFYQSVLLPFPPGVTPTEYGSIALH